VLFRIASFIVVAAALALTGCAHSAPRKLSQDKDIIAAKKRTHPAAASGARIAFAPVEVLYATDDPHPSRVRVPLDAGELRTRLTAALTEHTPLKRVTPIEYRRDRQDVDLVVQALERGEGSILKVRVKDFRQEFRGRNALYWPNLVVWAFVWAPALWVRDEDFAAVIDAEVILLEVPSEKLLAAVPVTIDVERSLDDWDRGIDLFGFLYLPKSLTSSNWEAVSEILVPHALAGLEKELVLRAHDRLVPALVGDAPAPPAAPKKQTRPPVADLARDAALPPAPVAKPTPAWSPRIVPAAVKKDALDRVRD
jgi:hypothetical protein